jgi:phosphopantetheine--protein transferase-like protein
MLLDREGIHGTDLCERAPHATQLDFERLVVERLNLGGGHLGTGLGEPLEGELAFAGDRPDRLATRLAAKEAVLKVLGTGWRGGIAWTDVEVTKESSGQPKIVLTGESQRIAREQGISRWHISISHIETHATASAIGLRGET